MSVTRLATSIPQAPSDSQSREQVFDTFRRWGYVQAHLDPLQQYLPPEPLSDLAITGEFAEEARAIYCGTVGAEFMHIADPERRRWIAEQLESPASAADSQRILDLLIQADIFEHVIQTRYLGTKRFSLEGVTRSSRFSMRC